MRVVDFLKNMLIKQNKQENNEKNGIKCDPKQSVNIEIIDENSYTKIFVGDFYTINEYVEKMQQNDEKGIDKLLNNSIAWNGKKQKINKGTYYIFYHNEKLYNILINDEVIAIDERTFVNGETLNKVLKIYSDDRIFSYFRCIHDKTGSTYNTRYYNPKDVSFMPLSKEDFLIDFNDICCSLSSFEYLKEIVDLNLIEQKVKNTNLKEFVK